MENTHISDQEIGSKIYYIRDQKVMLDSDLAILYGIPTGQLNRAVNRNTKRFPEDFMFRLTNEEFKNLIFQFGTSSWGGSRKPPHVFTEQGVAMLSGVLNSDRAIAVNIQIMRIFIKVRQLLSDNTELRLEIEKIKNKINNQDKNMEVVFQYLDELSDRIQSDPEPEPEPRPPIGFKLNS